VAYEDIPKETRIFCSYMTYWSWGCSWNIR